VLSILKKGANMIKSKEVFEMEKKLMGSISLGFFEHGTHNDMDLVIYEAYSSVQFLRKMLDEYEKQLREVAEEIMDEYKREKGG